MGCGNVENVRWPRTETLKRNVRDGNVFVSVYTPAHCA